MEEHDPNSYMPKDELLLPRLPRSLPFDELVFIIEDRITALIELPYSFEHVHSAPFYVSMIRPIVASLILPYDDDADDTQSVHTLPGNQYSFPAGLHAKSSKTNLSAIPTKAYSFKDQHRGIVAALLVARLEFLYSASEGFSSALRNRYDYSDDMMFKERGVLEARAYTAELVATKFLSYMTNELDRIEFLTYEYNAENNSDSEDDGDTARHGPQTQETSSRNPRIINHASKSTTHLSLMMPRPQYAEDELTIPRTNSNTALSKSASNIISFPSSSLRSQSPFFEDRKNGLYGHNSPVGKTFKSRQGSFSEQTPLLHTDPENKGPQFMSKSQPSIFSNLYNLSPSMGNAVGSSSIRGNVPINTNSENVKRNEIDNKGEWGYSAHDRLVDHGLFIKQYSEQCSLDLALVGSQPAREFITSDVVQSVTNGLWTGRIMYWKTIEAGAKKSVHVYNPLELVDWYSRLRVPRYRAFFMMINYSILLTLFYVLLFQKHQNGDAVLIEVFLNIWFVGFVLDEVSQAREAGSFAQYFADFWSFFDLCIVVFFMMFACLRGLGILFHNNSYTDLSYDILSLEAVLLVPRLFSFLSISPYFGTLLPCLRDLTVEFFKFLVLIVIISMGFLTTFSFLGRDNFSFHDMSWLLIRVFFGSSFAGFEAAPKISPLFGPPLMLIFVTLTNILLVTVLISILSERFSRIMHNAKQEYAIHFLSTVIESVNTSDRVSYFYPPINILSVVIRPLRVVYDHDTYRALRVKVLKATHWPFVALVWAYENASLGVRRRRIKKYLKIRRDQRVSMVNRMALQSTGIFEIPGTGPTNGQFSRIFDEPGFNSNVFNPVNNPFLFNNEENDSDMTTQHNEDEYNSFRGGDLEHGDKASSINKQKKKFVSSRRPSVTTGNNNVSKRRVWKRSETFFPKFKRFPKNLKTLQS